MIRILCLVVSTVSISGLAATHNEKQVVRDYLLERGAFPDNLTVKGGIEVDLNYDNTQQVGRFFNLYLQIKNTNGQVMQGQDVELLILLGSNSVAPYTLMRWQTHAYNAESVTGTWQGERLIFADLFLTRDLPQNSRLAVLLRSPQRRGDVYYLQTFPIASVAAKTSLAKPLTYEVLESYPPRVKWTLNFNKSIAAASTITWYTAIEGDITNTDKFTTGDVASVLTIMDKPHRTYGEEIGCAVLVVKIADISSCRDTDTDCRNAIYHQPEVIAATQSKNSCILN